MKRHESRDTENPAVAGLSSEAAEGIRTLDLLHGKQNLRGRHLRNTPANGRLLATMGSRTLPGIYREITGVWVVNG